MDIYKSVSINYNTTTQSLCSICSTHNPDFIKSPNELCHLKCLSYQLTLNPSFFDLTSVMPSDLIRQTYFCFYCEESEYLYTCQNCNKYLCLPCAVHSENRACCPNFKSVCEKMPKECISCKYSKPITKFCLDFKCENHDFLCKKCWNFGQNRGKCVFGCKPVTNFLMYAECLKCKMWKPAYFGELSCGTGCEVCETCYFTNVLKKQFKCPVCCLELR